MSGNVEQQKPFITWWKHGSLIVLLCLLAWNIHILVSSLKAGYSGANYTGMVVVIMLLLNHVAYFYATSGRLSKIMKVFARVWLIIAGIYISTWLIIEGIYFFTR